MLIYLVLFCIDKREPEKLLRRAQKFDKIGLTSLNLLSVIDHSTQILNARLISILLQNFCYARLKKMSNKFLKLKGANMDINLTTDSDKIAWKQEKCPWNKEEDTKKHKCAVKNISICDYFRGIEPDDIVICAYKRKK